MAWLVRGEDVLASLDVADSFGSRLKGLLGRDGIDGAFLIRPAKSVHTFGMKFAIDVAYCDHELTVVDAVTMPPNRLGLPRPKARCVIEAQAGAFERWRLKPGDRLEIPRMTEPGKLVVIATPIGNLGDLSPRAAVALGAASVIACEDTRHSRKLFAAIGMATPKLISVHKDNEVARVREILDLLADGNTVALITDAGTPAVSDPGRHVVEAAAAAGVRVESIPGASAVTTALAATGFPADRFVFEGFLPRKGSDRRERLAAIASETRTTVLYEAPTRVAKTLHELADACGFDRPVVVGRELTKLHEEYFRGTLAAAALRFADNARGEFVIVLEGVTAEPPAIDDAVIVAALRDALAAGESKRTAAEDVAAVLGVKRNRVYKLANEIRT